MTVLRSSLKYCSPLSVTFSARTRLQQCIGDDQQIIYPLRVLWDEQRSALPNLHRPPNAIFQLACGDHPGLRSSAMPAPMEMRNAPVTPIEITAGTRSHERHHTFGEEQVLPL